MMQQLVVLVLAAAAGIWPKIGDGTDADVVLNFEFRQNVLAFFVVDVVVVVVISDAAVQTINAVVVCAVGRSAFIGYGIFLFL